MHHTMNDDEVVEEMDVFLSKTLIDKLILLQYPARPADRPYDGRQVLCAKIKPKQKKIEVQMTLNTHSRNYDRSKAEQIALNTDGAHARYGTGDTYFNSSRMDKQVLTSTRTALSSGCYVVGRFSEGRCHLTPINTVLQMRPSFEYLDKSYALGHMEDSNHIKEEEEEAQAITVKFAGPNAEKVKKIREKSYSYLQQQSDAEPWTATNYNDLDSQRSKLEFQNLLCTQTESESANMAMPTVDHLRVLVPECLVQSQETTKVEPTSSVLCSQFSNEIRLLMLNAQVLRFDQVMELLPEEQAPNAEKYLQQNAVLVQGCWVIKSDALYSKVSSSPYSGINVDMLIRTRDYILWTFTKAKYVSRSDVLAVIRIPHEDVTAILEQVAKKVYHKGWEFKCPRDQEYIDNHPNVVQRQDMLWDCRYKQLARELRLGQMIQTESSPRKSFPPPPSPKERRHFKYRESFSGDDTEESGAESSSSVEKMDVEYSRKGHSYKRTFGGRKRSSTSPIKNGPRSRHPSSSGFEIPPTFLSALPSMDVKFEVLHHVRDVVYERYCLTLNELRETLSEASLGFIAQREDCDSLLEETLSEIGAQKLKNKWPQNARPAVLYAFTKFGTNLDRYREALLDLFTSTARSRPNFLIKKIEEENGEIISDSVCKQIFEEYCLYKAGYYYLKGTITPDS